MPPIAPMPGIPKVAAPLPVLVSTFAPGFDRPLPSPGVRIATSSRAIFLSTLRAVVLNCQSATRALTTSPCFTFELQIDVDQLSDHARGYGSPTILVDGQDVADKTAGDSDDCCRVYQRPEGFAGVPSAATVAARLTDQSRTMGR